MVVRSGLPVRRWPPFREYRGSTHPPWSGKGSQMVCGAGPQVAGRANSTWGGVGTRWQVPLIGPLGQFSAVSFWSNSPMRLRGPKARFRTLLEERRML